MPCDGNSEQTCCTVKGENCQYLIFNYTDEDGLFRKFACSLRAELGDWDAVLSDPRYIKNIAGSWAPGINCRDWPEKPNEYRGCNLCGSCM